MVPDDAHNPGLGYDHGHAHHSHGPMSPHPAQPASWSILRMTLLSRIGVALAASAAMWGVVWLAMRPT